MDTRSSKKRKLADTDLAPSQMLNVNPTKRSKEFGITQMLKYLE
jgi:transposase